MENEFKTWMIRSYTPLIAGLIITGAAKIMAPIDGELATAFAYAIATTAYGTLAHWLETAKGSKWGKWLLGSAKAPSYGKHTG